MTKPPKNGGRMVVFYTEVDFNMGNAENDTLTSQMVMFFLCQFSTKKPLLTRAVERLNFDFCLELYVIHIILLRSYLKPCSN